MSNSKWKTMGFDPMVSSDVGIDEFVEIICVCVWILHDRTTASVLPNHEYLLLFVFYNFTRVAQFCTTDSSPGHGFSQANVPDYSSFHSAAVCHFSNNHQHTPTSEFTVKQKTISPAPNACHNECQMTKRWYIPFLEAWFAIR
jgi:hypothetical protein